MHVDKPYQVVFGEELGWESWLRNEESGGYRVKGTHTPTPVLPKASPEVADGPSNEVTDWPFDPGHEDGYGANMDGSCPSST